MMTARKAYPSDVSDAEWALVAPYLTLLPEGAGQRDHPLREVFNGLRYIVKTGAPWRWMPHDLPPWAAVYQQAQRWLTAGCFAALVEDLRAVLRLAAGRGAEPSAAVLDSRTPRSTPESGARGGYDGAKRKKGSKVHMAVDTLGHLCWRSTSRRPRRTTAPRSGDRPRRCRRRRGRAWRWPSSIRATRARGRPKPPASTGLSWRWSSRPRPSAASCSCPGAGWPERTFAWTTRFRRLVRDYERLPQTLADLHVVALVGIMLKQAAQLYPVHNSLRPLHDWQAADSVPETAREYGDGAA